MDRIRQMLADASEQFDAMRHRDRWLATGLAATLAVLLAAAVVFGAYSLVEDARSRLDIARERLADVTDLAAEQEVLAAKLQAVEARMERFNPSQVATYVESWATQSGVKPQLKEVRETSSTTVGEYKERDYRIELDDAQLPNVVKFLYAMETAPFPVRVRTASFKSRKDRRAETTVIDLTVDLVTYSRDNGEG